MRYLVDVPDVSEIDVAADGTMLVLTPEGVRSWASRCPGGTADRCAGTARLTGRIGRRTCVLASAPFALTGGQAAQLTLVAKRSLVRRVGSRSDRRRGRHPVRLAFRMTVGRGARVQTITFRS